MPATIPPRHDKKLPWVQVLRGIAASLVVFYHYAASVRAAGVNRSWISASGLGEMMQCGVDIFFVLSGFIMVYTTSGKAGGRDARVFLLRRIVRIYPLYWFWTTVILMLVAAGVVYRSSHFTFAEIASSYLLYPLFTRTHHRPLLGQGWTLWFEMAFYLLFACTLWVKAGRFRLLFLGASFCSLAAAAHLLPMPSGLQYLFSQSMIVEFLLGVLVAEVLLRLPVNSNPRWVQKTALMTIVAGCIILPCTVKMDVTDSSRLFYYGIPSALIVTGAVMLGSRTAPRWLVYLGDASYSIYLVHGLFVWAFIEALGRRIFFDRIPGDAEIVVLGIMTICLSSLSYPFLEKHLIRAFSRGRAGRPVLEVQQPPPTE